MEFLWPQMNADRRRTIRSDRFTAKSRLSNCGITKLSDPASIGRKMTVGLISISGCRLVSEHKLFGVEQRPGQVLQRWQPVAVGLSQERLSGGQFVGRGLAAESGPVQFLDNFAVRRGRSLASRAAADCRRSASRSFSPSSPIERQGLLERRFVRPFAFAGQQPLGLAERLQEPIGGARPLCRAGERGSCRGPARLASPRG